MDFDVVIVGGGLAGASLAAALSATGLRLAVIERAPPVAPREEWDSRIYSLTPASIAFLEEIGAWQGIESGRVASIREMRVHGDSGHSRLDFSAYESGLLQLAATAESSRLQRSLWQDIERRRNVTLLCPAVPSRLRCEEDSVEIELEDGRALSAKLAVGSDGADSWVRRAAAIESRGRNYGQLGVVANFACALEHRNIAYQWFRRDGVLAYLPLPGRRVSIVWSTPESHARELLALSPQALARRVAEAGRESLGALELLAQPAAFPLGSRFARTMVLGRIALIGDAAHVVHPLAGQGVNLGLGDAHCLAELLRDARDPGDRMVLRRYERARAGELLALRCVTEGLFRLFHSEHRVVAQLRNFGLNLVNTSGVLKTLLARRAVAVGGSSYHKELS
jgi:2-octaprenylphenol hydroxylase